MADKSTQFFAPGEFSFVGTTGTWTLTEASQVLSWLHSTAANTSVCSFVVPKNGLSNFTQQAVRAVHIPYTVVTADLGAAPTVAVYKHTYADSTGVVTVSSAVTAALTFGGVDAIGLAAGAAAAGTHTAIITPGTVAANVPTLLTALEYLSVELTLNAAATSVLAITGLYVDYA